MSGVLPDLLETDEPASLHRVMQATIGHGLKQRYEVQRDLPHELFVLLMQMNSRKQKPRNVPKPGR